MWFNSIKNQLDNLPGEQAHLEMVPYRKLSSSYKTDSQNAKQSAVLCLLTKQKEDIYCLLIERQNDGGKHSGQIAFPGGKKDEEDIDLKQTALRETQEEVGINPNDIKILGQLTPVYIPVSHFFVQPFIGVTNDMPTLNLSEKEVKQAFFFNVNSLLDENCKTTRHIKNHKGITMKNIPCFILNNKVVWGATSLILNELRLMMLRGES